jgi:hypothetical protein
MSERSTTAFTLVKVAAAKGRVEPRIDVESGCITRLAPQHGTGHKTDASLLLSVSSSWPPCSSRRRCHRWRLHHRSATPSGAVDSGDAAWRISGRGTATQNPRSQDQLAGSFPDTPRYSQLPGDTTDGDYWLMLVLGGQVGWFDEVKRKWSVGGRGRPRYWRGIAQQLAAAGIYRRTLTATNHNTLPNSYDKDRLSRPVDSGLGSNGRSDRQLF